MLTISFFILEQMVKEVLKSNCNIEGKKRTISIVTYSVNVFIYFIFFLQFLLSSLCHGVFLQISVFPVARGKLQLSTHCLKEVYAKHAR